MTLDSLIADLLKLKAKGTGGNTKVVIRDTSSGYADFASTVGESEVADREGDETLRDDLPVGAKIVMIYQ